LPLANCAAVAPPDAGASPAPAEPIENDGEQRRRPWYGALALRSPPWATSAVVHAALLLILGLWTLPALLVGGPVSLETVVEEVGAEDYAPLAALDALAVDGPQPAGESAASSAPAAAARLETSSPPLELDSQVEDALALAAADALAALDPLARVSSDDLAHEARGIRRRSVEGTGNEALLAEAGTVEAAVDRITGQLEMELADGDLLVVWMFDASISLLGDRQRVAEHLKPFYERIAGRDAAESFKLMNAAVSFGAGCEELVGPSKFGGRVVAAARDMPIDPSGIENVMTAVEETVYRYRRRWHGPLALVIWTDESGDDILRLENTIRVCQEEGASVSVVGPTAVLGREPSLHLFRHPDNGMSYLLGVKRGPDTAIPERLRMPYWYTRRMPEPNESIEDAEFTLPPLWQMDVHLEGLHSGFGPYALTRLARETGGTFTILDPPQDRGPFRLEALRAYLPELGPADSYLTMCQDRPLRRAVLAAVQRTYQNVPLGPPQMTFFGQWVHPGSFRGRLKDALEEQREGCADALALIEGALDEFGEAGLEEEWQIEYEPRWRAWYDLTRGRLLAMSVRFTEYLALSELLLAPGALDAGTNRIVLVAAPILRTSSLTETRAREAKRLLRRCVKDHAGTPWALLAERELDHALGIDVEQYSVPQPPPRVVAPGGPRGGGVGLPSL
jgi:hypothetical protein